MNVIIRIVLLLYTLASIAIALVGAGWLLSSRGPMQTVGVILFGTGFIGFALGFCVDYLNGIFQNSGKQKKIMEDQLQAFQNQIQEQRITNIKLEEFLSNLMKE